MKKLFVHVIAGIAVVGTVWFGMTHRDFLVGTAFAVGDLIIDWNVPAGDPIFVVSDFAPGEMESRDVDVTNGASVPRDLGVVGVETSELGGLSDVLEITISEGATDLYGGSSAGGVKTLTQFFAESTPNEIPLRTLAAGEIVTLAFKVKFSDSAGNEYQNANVVFDITLGLVSDVPAECQQIDFSSGQTIFGTQKGDSLFGTTGNDLIFGLEGGDAIYGRGGNDCVVGGLGGDFLSGEAGDDVLVGGSGGDALIGGAGHDQMFGQADGDSLGGGAGNDVGYGGSGPDGLTGGDGNDQLFGEIDNDSAAGGRGTDTCDAEGESSCEL